MKEICITIHLVLCFLGAGESGRWDAGIVEVKLSETRCVRVCEERRETRRESVSVAVPTSESKD